MAQADSVPSLLRVPITGASSQAPTTGPTLRWCERITGRMAVGWYILALCCATAVILLGWWPWNLLLILPLFLCGSSRHGSSA
jgi:hypothetical protein